MLLLSVPPKCETILWLAYENAKLAYPIHCAVQHCIPQDIDNTLMHAECHQMHHFASGPHQSKPLCNCSRLWLGTACLSHATTDGQLRHPIGHLHDALVRVQVNPLDRLPCVLDLPQLLDAWPRLHCHHQVCIRLESSSAACLALLVAGGAVAAHECVVGGECLQQVDGAVDCATALVVAQAVLLLLQLCQQETQCWAQANVAMAALVNILVAVGASAGASCIGRP